MFATHLLPVAIFLAVLPSAIGGTGARFGYGLDARGADWRTARTVEPVAIVAVTGADLPPIAIG